MWLNKTKNLKTVALIALEVINGFGPMKRAESLVQGDVKYLQYKAAMPDASNIKVIADIKERVGLNFILPTVMLVIIAIGSFLFTGTVMVLEDVIFVLAFMPISFSYFSSP